MEYIRTFDNFDDDLIMEKIDFNSLLSKLKFSINKKTIAKTIVISLLSILTVSQAYNFIEKQVQDFESKKIIENELSRYKDASELRLSKEGWRHIKEHEKLKLTAYSIKDGRITIGYGHAKPERRSKYRVGDKITIEQAEKLLHDDLNLVGRSIRNLFMKWKLEGRDIKITQEQYDVLVSLGFNMGVGNLRHSDFIKALKKKEFEKASELIKITGLRKGFPGLESRRLIEYNKFIK